MPGVKRSRDESENEEADQETETDRSTEEQSSSSEASDGEDSSELDEEECERRRGEFLSDLNELESQFSQLREQLYQERITQVQAKLEEVREETAPEYLGPLAELKEALKIRLEVTDILRDLRNQNVCSKHEAEVFASKQNYQNEVDMLWDMIESELEEKIRRLEEDRNNVDVTSQVWAEQNLHRKHKRCIQGTNTSNEIRRRKPTTVSGPYIVYMLRETDILEDWTAIKKALTASKRKSKFGKFSSSPRHVQEFVL
ncbi:UNVERIFIED_CONTAM: hypothetical protein RMT77_003440 [Armadillidium vulgare]|nr:Breast cancer metastasis-suppressor 1-like protein [Armadillidium vulgare]